MTPKDYSGGAWFALSDTSEVAVAWFFLQPLGDVLGLVYRDAADAPWRATVRVRTQVDDQIEGSADRKTGYEIGGGSPDDHCRDELVDKVGAVFAKMLVEWGGRIERFDVYGPAAAFIRELRKRPWAHARIVSEGPRGPQ